LWHELKDEALMTQPADSNDSQRTQPINRSVEATKVDDARDKELHEDEKIAGVTAGTDLGCLDIALLPWSLIALALLVTIAIIVIAKLAGGTGCERIERISAIIRSLADANKVML
jgi:hypothetical protein